MKKAKYFTIEKYWCDELVEIRKKITDGEIITFNKRKYGIHKNKVFNRYVITDIITGRTVTSVENKENVLPTLNNLSNKIDEIITTNEYQTYIKDLQNAKLL